MGMTVPARHALWTLHTLMAHGPIGRFELANELRYLRPRDLSRDQAERIMGATIGRLLARHEIIHIGSNGHSPHTYHVTAAGRAELARGLRRLAARGHTIEHTVTPPERATA